MTMRDVARHAGVSVATVSHVLNGTRRVTAETCRRVEESIRALGYRPNAAGRILKTGRRNLIGCVVPDIANSFFAAVIEEAEEVVGSQGYRLIVANTREDRARELGHVQALAEGMVDGLLLASTCEDDAELARLIPKEMPCVLFDRDLPGERWDRVLISDYGAVREGVQALLRKGHRRIGYIAGPAHLSTTAERLHAYRDALGAQGLPFDESIVRYGDSMSRSATGLVEELLEQNCDAIAVSNNVMTDDALHLLGEWGLRLGDRLDLLGYETDRRVPRRAQAVPMIRQPVRQFGRRVGMQIVDRLRNPTGPIRSIVLEATFLPRDQ